MWAVRVAVHLNGVWTVTVRRVVCAGSGAAGMPDGKSFEQLEKEKKEAKAKAEAEAEKKAEPLVLEEDDEFEEFEQEGA